MPLSAFCEPISSEPISFEPISVCLTHLSTRYLRQTVSYTRHRIVSLLPVACLMTVVMLPGAAQHNPPSLDPTYGLRRPGLQKPAAHKPGAEAQWIWAGITTDVQTVFLRGTVTLPKAPVRARIDVTADDFFTLFINGQQVDKSQLDPNDNFVWKHVHQVEVARYMKEGRNVIALQAVNAGGSAGAVAQLEVNGKPALLTGPNWKVAPAGTPPADWSSRDYDDAAWPAAHVVAPLTGGAWAGVGGIEGWPGYNVDVPYLAHMTIEPVAALDIQPGKGSITADAQHPLVLTVTPAASGAAPPAITLDFGKELAGRVRVTANGELLATVGTGESREEAETSPWAGVHQLNIDAGRPAYSPYSAFRYARLSFASGFGSNQSQVAVKVTVDHKYYPVTYKGTFACSDDLLTRIWYIGAYTAHLCMQEDIWDAPKRDRARWMGDLHVSGEVINIAFADRFLMEQTMTALREEAQGGQPDTALPRGHVNGISGYSCAWICGLADFHRHLGDDSYLKREHDLLVSMLDYMRGDLDERGLYANRHKAWSYVDWAPDFNADSPYAYAATHMFYIKAAKEAAFLFKEMGDAANAARSAAWADEMTQAAQQYLFKPDTHLLSDRRQDNSMAIYAGVATSEETTAIYEAVLRPDSPAWSRIASPYYNNYVIYAMSMANNHTAATLDILRRYWGGMLAEGATSWWEAYDPTWEKQDFHAHLQADNGTGYFVSLCHGWSAGPTSWLTERVLGVRPTSGGFATVDIAPEPCDLTWAAGDVPTPRGLIRIRIEKKSAKKKTVDKTADTRNATMMVTVILPPGTDASFIWHGQAVQHWNTAGKHVAIVAP
jgi:alpha-L-rhamnosidase